MKFRKRPIVIEAMQFVITKEIPCKFGIHKKSNSMEIAKFMGQTLNVRTVPTGTKEGRTYIEIPTLKEPMEANINDYVVKDINGEFYPCKPDIFEKTYEREKVFRKWKEKILHLENVFGKMLRHKKI